MPMDQPELSTHEVLRRDIPWETYMTTKLITGTGLQLLRRYDKKPENYKAQLLDEDGPAYVRVFVSILRDIFKEETVEYVLALIDEMLSANPKRAKLFHDKSFSGEDIYDPFLRLLWKGSWFVQEKSSKILTLIVSERPRSSESAIANGASNSKKEMSIRNDVLKGLIEWLCTQLKRPSHPSRAVPASITCLTTLLKEGAVRSSFVQSDGVKLLIPFISPASTQQSIQLLYETCLCVWLLSYYDPAIEYLATSRALPRLIEVVKGSTKEKVVRVVILTLKNLLPKGAFGAQMVDLGVLQLVQNLKAQAWSDEDLLEALNQLEEGLRDSIKKLSSFDMYKQEVLLGQLDWSPMHKDPIFWRDNITSFEEHDFQILRVLITILDTSTDSRTLAVACYDLSQFIQYHPAGRVIVSDLKAKDRVMKLMNHENAEVTKNALLCIQRLFLGAKYASFLQFISSGHGYFLELTVLPGMFLPELNTAHSMPREAFRVLSQQHLQILGSIFNCHKFSLNGALSLLDGGTSLCNVLLYLKKIYALRTEKIQSLAGSQLILSLHGSGDGGIEQILFLSTHSNT